MKRFALIILLVAGMIAVIQAQTAEPPRTGFENVQVLSAEQELEIQIKAMIPDISVVQLKTDTYARPGIFDYTINLGSIQQESKQQLTNWQTEINNWLEESK
jgi:hypothetical protein